MKEGEEYNMFSTPFLSGMIVPKDVSISVMPSSEMGARSYLIGWQCPGCLSYYSPEIKKCKCAQQAADTGPAHAT